jgi:hypothetical protein
MGSVWGSELEETREGASDAPEAARMLTNSVSGDVIPSSH